MRRCGLGDPSQRMQFSIITPSYRNSEALRLCIESVADQVGVTLEHIIQDAGSDDGTLDWLLKDPRVSVRVEKDSGMYDAINRGFRRATGEIVAYLNCDEQYLQGTLQSVYEFFRRNPHVEVAFGDVVVTAPSGRYICHRKALLPLRAHVWYRFSVLTCATFLRREALEKHHLYFDTSWRVVGDVFWVLEMLNRRVSMGLLRQFTSSFGDTGKNLSLHPEAEAERARLRSITPLWVRALRPLIIQHHRLRMLLNGAYTQRPFQYAIYTEHSPTRRVHFTVEHPTGLWRERTRSIFLFKELRSSYSNPD